MAADCLGADGPPASNRPTSRESRTPSREICYNTRHEDLTPLACGRGRARVRRFSRRFQHRVGRRRRIYQHLQPRRACRRRRREGRQVVRRRLRRQCPLRRGLQGQRVCGARDDQVRQGERHLLLRHLVGDLPANPRDHPRAPDQGGLLLAFRRHRRRRRPLLRLLFRGDARPRGPEGLHRLGGRPVQHGHPPLPRPPRRARRDDEQDRRLGGVRPLGPDPHQKPRRRPGSDDHARHTHLRGRLLQLPHRRQRDAPGDRR